MEIVTALAGSIISCLCTPERANALVVDRAKHVISPTKGLQTLEELKEKLVAQVADVSQRLHIEEIEKGKLRSSVVAKWLQDANFFLEETDAIEQEVKRAKGCLKGLWPNCRSRANLGEHMSELIMKATALSENVPKLSDEYLALHVLEIGMERPTKILVGAQRTLGMVWECFVDNKSRVFGVYGIGGVGKTAIMTAAHNKLVKQEHLFDKVIWITVSKDANVHKLQNDIAGNVSLDLSLEQDPNRRSALLLRTLQRRGRIAYILDDVWETFHLHEVGVPNFTEDNGCKLVLTTRSLDVCQRMNCRPCIKVEPLLEEDAWKLFIKTVGLELAPNVENIARALVKECAGLPLAIITVGGALRGNDEPEWRVALTELQKKESTTWSLDMEGKVFKCLEFSYNHLQDDILKKCFLYCALYPEDFEINAEELIDHWVMEGLIRGSSMTEELNQGRRILNKLNRCSMLEYGVADSGPWEYVKLHDLIRDMALHMTKMNPHFMVKTGGKLKKLLDEKEWEGNLEKASFMESDVNEILISPSCPELVTLLLNRIPLKIIADEFFVKMLGLRVLNLSNTEIELLPDSFSDLVNLHVLDVSWCKLLKRVPSVEKLQSLRVLRFAETAIEELPHGMEALSNLKRLDLMRTRLREIPSSLIPKFSLLQELLVYPLHHSFGFVDELLSLILLENISISFSDFSDLTSFVGLVDFKRLNHFFFDVRHGLDMSEFHPTRRRSVTVCNDSHHIPKDVLRIPESTEYLGIMEFNELTRLSELTCLKDVTNLKKCCIRECSKMEYIFSSEDFLLKDLEDIIVKGCHNLTTIYKGVPAPGSLSCLKKLYFSQCHNLKYLFSLMLLKELQNLVQIYIDYCELEELIVSTEEEMDEWDNGGFTLGLKKLKLVKLPKLKTLFSMRILQYFQNLEEVEVLYCNGIEELVAKEARSRGSDNNSIKLPMLKKLDLVNLPELKSIWSGEMVCDVLQSVRVSSCPQLKRLPQFIGEDQLPQPSLREIKGSSEWWDSLEWDGPSAKNLLQPLFRVHW